MKKTLLNVLQAYVGESQARNRYDFYGKVAKKEGYEQIASLFFEISKQEKTHGKNFFRMYKRLQKESNEPEIEHFENSELYPGFAKVAEEEGFPKIAVQIRAIAKAEEHHEEIFTKLLKELEAGTVFKKDEQIWWVCIECGYIHYGKEAPNNCPSCNHPKAYFQRKSEEF
ncbi:MAG: rubrerythrin family protein [Promethearchaeota archaeon]